MKCMDYRANCQRASRRDTFDQSGNSFEEEGLVRELPREDFGVNVGRILSRIGKGSAKRSCPATAIA